MRITTYAKGGYIDGGFTSGGGTMTGPLILAGSPTVALEASTKQYVDNVTAKFDAGKFTSGVLQVGRLPAFTGDLISTTGSNNLSLAPSGVTAGIYTKVSVNSKGLITAGGSLVESDLPDLDWGKITSDKPSTLTGYGITDALSLAGGTVSGALTLHADPVSSLQLATKQYVDNNAGTASPLKVGDIVSKMVTTTPAGFLRCNGGQVSKTTYSALYAVVGDTFSYYEGIPGKGRPWEQQYGINMSSNGNISSWTMGANKPSPCYEGEVLVTKNRVYLLGGTNNISNSYLANMQTAVIAADGTIGPWETTEYLPSAMSGFALFVVKNRVYITGGRTGSSTVGVKTYYATIGADGKLSAWTDALRDLPASAQNIRAVMTNGKVYLLGTTYWTNINNDGSLDGWQTSGNLLGFTPGAIVQTKNRVIVFSNADSTIARVATVDSITGVLGAWTATAGLPAALRGVRVVVTNNRVCAFGGDNNLRDDGGYVAYWTWVSVYYADIYADGSLSGWSNGTSLPQGSSTANVFVTGNKVYLVAGYSPNATDNVIVGGFTGGLNDYSPYLDGSITPTSSTNFNLPDLTKSDIPGTYSYIKF